ncbi:Acyl-CoA N-acyltransferase [Penicillium verhagenii]|nr:Acyl-CoA N-acyltransferase [Penicillium verhagenii]
MSTNKTSENGLRIEPITQAQDIIEAFESVSEAFGRQAQDGVWIAMTPGWDTPEGRSLGAARMVTRWRGITQDMSGKPTAVFLKATLPSPDDGGKRIIVGCAIWVQGSSVAGYGEPAVKEEDLCDAMNLEEIYPGNESEQRYCCQVVASMHKQRREVLEEKATEYQPAVMILDLCAVHPAHQRKGIARALVQWGLVKLDDVVGFVQEGPEIEYVVDAEFISRSRPSNIFMRTRASA